MDDKSYKKYAEARAKKSPSIKNCVMAFCTGGAICTAGHGIFVCPVRTKTPEKATPSAHSGKS